jgi:hypothetical protein
MNVIFLDFDGVIVTVKSRYRHGDKNCVHWLNKVLKVTGASIVVSSSWRLGENPVTLQNQLTSWGVQGTVIGQTPHLRGMDVERGDEIKAYLDKCRTVPSSFVILDDDSDMRGCHEYHVKCDYLLGMTEQDAEKAIAILNGIN